MVVGDFYPLAFFLLPCLPPASFDDFRFPHDVSARITLIIQDTGKGGRLPYPICAGDIVGGKALGGFVLAGVDIPRSNKAAAIPLIL